MKTCRHAFIFDMDGVVIDSSPLRRQATALYLEGLGVRVKVPTEPMEGWTNAQIFRALLGKNSLSDDEVRQHSDAADAIFYEIAGPNVGSHLVPGIMDFLLRWDGMPTALASNAEPEAIDFVLDGARLRRFFDTITYPGQSGRPKPFPDIYLAAAARLGVAPSDCIVFEDSLPGIQAALAASMSVVAVQPPNRSNLPGVIRSIPNFLIDGLDIWINELLCITR